MTLRNATLCLLAAFLLAAGPRLAAQEEPQAGDDAPPAPVEEETDADDDNAEADADAADDGEAAAAAPRVLCTYRFERRLEPAPEEPAPEPPAVDAFGCPDGEDHRTVHLGHHLVVRVAGLDRLLAAGEGEEKKGVADLRLFLDGVEMTDLEPEAVQRLEVDGDDPETLRQVAATAAVSDVRFQLDRDADNRAAWRTLLGPFKLKAREVSVGVGIEDEEEIAGSSDAALFLEAIQKGWLWFYLVLLLAIFLLFFAFRWRGRRLTDSLRDAQATGSPKPYSLARCQMAWWFFLVIAAYVFLWLVLGDLDTITGSILTLMGIGSGTALGAAMIDGSKKAEESQAAAEVVVAAKATAGGSAADQVRLADAQVRLANAQGAVKKDTRGFLSDVLSDGNGYSFHRFQIAVWTIILGIIFVVSVLHELAMPQFSETLLALMGISSGTYLGFKFPERFQ